MSLCNAGPAGRSASGGPHIWAAVRGRETREQTETATSGGGANSLQTVHTAGQASGGTRAPVDKRLVKPRPSRTQGLPPALRPRRASDRSELFVECCNITTIALRKVV